MLRSATVERDADFLGLQLLPGRGERGLIDDGNPVEGAQSGPIGSSLDAYRNAEGSR